MWISGHAYQELLDVRSIHMETSDLTPGSTFRASADLTRDGRCSATLLVDGKSARLIRIGNVGYVTGVGAAPEVPPEIASGQKWVRVPARGALWKNCSLRWLTSAVKALAEDVVFNAGHKRLDGVPVEEATDDPDTARIFVSLQRPWHTMRIEIDKLKTRIDLSRYNRPVRIVAPPASDMYVAHGAGV